jgi:parallel beta-helix repeat protein
MSLCIDCQDIPGNNVVFVDTSDQPFCQDCSGENACIEKLDAQCVVYHIDNPTKPNKIENLGLGNGATAEQVFEAISNMIGNNLNVPLVVTDTQTIDLTSTGPLGHNLKADIKRSLATGNALVFNSDGLFVPADDGKVKVNATDAADYLINQMVGGTDGIVSNSVFVSNGQVKIQPSIDAVLLMAHLCSLIDFRNCVSEIAGEQSGTTLTANDSPSINFTTSGTENHTLTGDVKLSATAGNQIAINSDGLYVPAPAAAVTASNGLNAVGSNVKLGGTVIEHTVLNGSNFDISFNPRRVYIGNQYLTESGSVVSAPAAAGSKFVVSQVQDVPNAGLSVVAAVNKITNTGGFSMTGGAVLSASYNYMEMILNSSVTINNSNVTAADLGILTLSVANAQTVTMAQSLSAHPRAMSAVSGVVTMSPFAGTNNGTITDVASISAYGPQQSNSPGSHFNHITNYYGVIVHDSREGLITENTVITNSYGVYQTGSSDQNEFRGNIRYYNGLTNASDSRIKDVGASFTTGLEAVKQIDPIHYTYKPSFQTTSPTFVGVLAQSVEGIIPECVTQAPNAGFSDFRFFDSTPLLYAMVNSIKQITGQVFAADYVSDVKSTPFVGATDGEAKLADLNALRVAYENLRADYDDLRAKLVAAGVLNLLDGGGR